MDSGARRHQVCRPATLFLNWYFGADDSQTRPSPKDSIWKAIQAVQLVLPMPTILPSQGCQVRGTGSAASKEDGLKVPWVKKYPDGHFELVVVEVTAEDGAFNDAVKGPYQLLNALGNTYIRYIEEIVNTTVNSTLSILRLTAFQPIIARFILTSSCISSGRGIPDGRLAWM